MDWDAYRDRVRGATKKYSSFHEWGTTKILEKIPLKERIYKCHTCFKIVEGVSSEEGEISCSNCGGTHLKIMCPMDHCDCHEDIISGIKSCEMCGEFICPTCGTHDVSCVSRVTGYLSDPNGWHSGKRQELKDRTRYNVA